MTSVPRPEQGGAADRSEDPTMAAGTALGSGRPPATPAATPLGAPSAAPMAALQWGAIFGLVAAVPAVGQVLLGLAAVAANQDGLSAYQSAVSGYQDCLRQAPDPSVCSPPPPGSSILAVLVTFYGTCLFAFLLTLVIYFFAGRQGAHAAGRRGPGIWAAVIAAAIGSIAYLIAGIIAVQVTGRSPLVFGITAPDSVAPGAWAATLTRATVAVDAIALLLTLGIAALVGLWGAAVGAPHPPTPPVSAMWPAGPYGAPPGAIPPYGGFPPGYAPYGPYGPGGPYAPYPPSPPYLPPPPGAPPYGPYPPAGMPPAHPVHPPHPGHPGMPGAPSHGTPTPGAPPNPPPPPPAHHGGS